MVQGNFRRTHTWAALALIEFLCFMCHQVHRLLLPFLFAFPFGHVIHVPVKKKKNLIPLSVLLTNLSISIKKMDLQLSIILITATSI
jgi:hypothetical protein